MKNLLSSSLFVGEEHPTKAAVVGNTNKGENEQFSISIRGIYFITITNTKTGKQEVSKFVIN